MEKSLIKDYELELTITEAQPDIGETQTHANILHILHGSDGTEILKTALPEALQVKGEYEMERPLKTRSSFHNKRMISTVGKFPIVYANYGLISPVIPTSHQFSVSLGRRIVREPVIRSSYLFFQTPVGLNFWQRKFWVLYPRRHPAIGM